ncbi:hypothetical protein [Agromyces protaetiae]|uniref:hypothetical protein n=1 Tax=Agromyces protaetiae TaxID=2509455 RepID=UPI001FB6901E|nr:hypothetical protein [Agromyces protaetiae]
MIDLEAVVALRAVATNGSVAAAADALGFTPRPSRSRSSGSSATRASRCSSAPVAGSC